jgi:hypothetical protein
MKTLYSIAIATCCFGAYAQGTFRNLDFERARLIPIEGWGFPYIATANAIPGWTAAVEQSTTDIIPYNVVSLGAPYITLQGTRVVSPFGTPVPTIQGDYSLLLQGSYPGAEVVPYIHQTGTLPLATRSLTFKINDGGVVVDEYFDVFFNDTELSTTRLAVTDDYELWGADLSDFSGDYGELKFRGQGVLDDIKFSPLEVPEPAAWSILLLGGAIIARFRKRI